MDPLFSGALRFLVLGGVGFKGYLLVSMNSPTPPLPLKPFFSLVPPLGGKFDAVRGIKVTGGGGRRINATH